MKTLNMYKWIPVLAVMAAACSSPQTQEQNKLHVADVYDSHSDQTTLTILPYGDIVIPGKWVKTDYNETSTQHFFTNSDSTVLAVSKNPHEKYPFYKKNLNDSSFVSEYFKWDADYLVKQGYVTKLIKDSSGNGYVVWQAVAPGLDYMYLFGSKEQFGYNLMLTSDQMNKVERVQFLEDVFLKN